MLLNESGSAQAEAEEGAPSGEGKEEVKPEAAAASAAQGKRKPSPGPDEPQAKRSRPDSPRKGRRVTEKEVVGVLVGPGRMRPKDLINPFKPHIRNKEDKDEFMKMVKLIGKLVKDGGESYVVLNDAAKLKYGISE